MTRTYLLSLLLGCSVAGFAQSPSAPERAVLTAVDRFFAAMTARDTAAMAQVIVREGMLHIAAEDGAKPVRSVSHADYLKRLAQGTERFMERYWEASVRVDGPLATATMPYDFHVDGAFSHCGVDVFTLVLSPEGWRIASVAFTRQTEGCPPSPLGPLKP